MLPRLLPLTLAAALTAFTTLLLTLAQASPPAPSPQAKLETTTEKLPGRGSTVTFEMIRIPAGAFTMKHGENTKDVTVKPFWIGKTEVTWEAYDVFFEGYDLPSIDNPDPNVHTKTMAALRPPVAKTRPSKPYGKVPDDDFGHNGYPLIRAHYFAAETYCRWLSQKTGKKYRLPTEAEWEWAARGGADATKPTAAQAALIAWYKDNATPDGGLDPQTHPVAKKQPNGYGLFDMFGNVAEWATVLDTTADTPELDRYVTKGGSFRSSLGTLHPAFRQFMTSTWQARDAQDPKSLFWLSDANFVGFRIVRED